MKNKELTIKIIDHFKKDGHAEYKIFIEKNNINITFSERYSQLKALNDLMKVEAKDNSFPKFPPKQFIKKETEQFLNKRQHDLNIYFETINNHPKFSKLKSFVKYIEDNLKKYGKSEVARKKGVSSIKKSEIQQIEDAKYLQLKNIDKECAKIVNEYSNNFMDINFYCDFEANDKNNFVNFFNNNKNIIDEKEVNIKLDIGDDKNFSYINNNDIDEISEQNTKEKIEKVINKFKKFDEIYNTNGIIVKI